MRKYIVKEIRNLTDSTFVVRLERNDFRFQTGQFVLLGLNGAGSRREYSVYSGENDETIDVLIREVKKGKISPKLKKLKPGTSVEMDGPFGFFKFNPDNFKTKKFLFIATGTGISPFHSFVKTYPGLNYTLLHGVRYTHENYDHADFDNKKIVLCTSGDNKGDFQGRVTDKLFELDIEPNTNCFLCGNSEMIYEAFDILTGKGVPVSNIYSEVYF